MIAKRIKNYPPIVGCSSLVGINTDVYPSSSGNYMWLSNGPYLVNMWAENLQVAAKRFNLTSIEVTEFSDGKTTLGVVTDKRLVDWTNKRICVTGIGFGSRALCEAVCSFLNVSTAEFICGCENQDEASYISMMMKSEPREITLSCRKCGRRWML